MTITKPMQQIDIMMKTNHNLLGTIFTVTQSKWMRPALLALAILVAVLGVVGCKPHHWQPQWGVPRLLN